MSPRNDGNLFWFQVHSELQRKTMHSKFRVSTSKFPQDPKPKREWLSKWRGLLYALEAFARLRRTLYRRQFRTKYCSKEFCWDTLSRFTNLYSKKTPYRRVLSSPWKVASRQLGKNNEKQINNTRRRADELLGHFPNKIRFIFRSKTFSKYGALTQKRNNVQENSDVTKQSLSSTVSI